MKRDLVTLVQAVTGSTPHMTAEQAGRMVSFIRDQNLRTILELGFYHGVSTCYMAAVLRDLGGGHITTIDLTNARTREPNIETLLSRLDLASAVTVHYEPTSYTWRLLKISKKVPPLCFTLSYLAGPQI